ncbi:hypothetical protein RZS08_52275, partial [Arthrospira platensis SPKY1]|nr:hypothetical protein [Arthrospira platensis SPKY1]
LETDIYFDRAGTYAVRVTATDAEGARSQLEFPVLVDRAPSGSVEQVLAFNAPVEQYVAANTNLRDSVPTQENNVQLIGDNTLTGFRRYYELSHQNSEGVWQNPLSPAIMA